VALQATWPCTPRSHKAQLDTGVLGNAAYDTLFEFTSDDWREEWWHSLRWRRLHSWELTESTRP
jgi:hypothetical protein